MRKKDKPSYAHIIPKPRPMQNIRIALAHTYLQLLNERMRACQAGGKWELAPYHPEFTPAPLSTPHAPLKIVTATCV